MEVKCVSNIDKKSGYVMQEITVGKSYEFLEKIPGGYIRIRNDLKRDLNYPVACFDMEVKKKVCREFPICKACGKKFIGKMEDEICKHCIGRQN